MHEPTQAAARRVDLAAPHTAVAMYPLVLAIKLGVYLVTGVLASMALAGVPLVRLLRTKERGPASAPRPGRWPRRSVAASTTPRTRGCAPSRLNRRRPHRRPSEEVAEMPPHCDSLDGPVVTAAARALQTGNVELVLPYVHPDGEAEVRQAFARVLPLRASGNGIGELADRWFYETVVRVHRAGEGAPYTGLKPAGLDPGPVLPLAEKAVATGDLQPVYELLAGELRHQLEQRLRQVGELAAAKDRSVAAARAWVEAMLGFEVYAHHTYTALQHGPHGEHQAG